MKLDPEQTPEEDLSQYLEQLLEEASLKPANTGDHRYMGNMPFDFDQQFPHPQVSKLFDPRRKII